MRALIPAELGRRAAQGPDWADWLQRLPRLVGDLAQEWRLSADGEAMTGSWSLVLPVRTDTGDAAVLKVSCHADDEGVHEALALQHWAGRGTVRLLRADPGRRALLLERLHREDLNTVAELEACEIVARCYRRLHVPALPQLRTVTSYLERWLDALDALPAQAPVPRRMVQHARSLGRDLVTDPQSVGRIVHGDLHGANVLAGEREPWLVIDPKPMSGDPHYEPAPMLWNRWDDLLAAGDVRGAVRRRFHVLVDTAGLDPDRARDWVIVRMVINASWTVEDAARTGRRLQDADRDWITRCITLAKAVQD